MRVRNSASLRTKITTAFALTGFAISMLVLVAVNISAAQQTSRSAGAAADRTQLILNRVLENDAAIYARSAGQLASLGEIQNLLTSESPSSNTKESARRALAQFRKAHGGHGLFIVGRDGLVLGSDAIEDLAADPDRIKPLIDRALTGSTSSKVLRVGQVLYHVTAVPMTIANYVQGIAFVYHGLDKTLAARVSEMSGSDVAFVVGGMHPYASSLAPEMTTELKVDDAGKVNLPGHLAVMSSIGSATDNNFGAVTLFDSREVDASFSPLRQLLLISALASLLVALSAGFILSRAISKPINGVVEAAILVSQGDYPAPFNSDRSDEIGHLHRVFDQMTASIREHRDRLLSILQIDPVTNLLNHTTFRSRLGQEIHRCDTGLDPLTLMLVDVEAFGAFNSGNGYECGDELVKTLGEVVVATCPDHAMVSRYKPGRIAVALPIVEIAAAENLARNISSQARFVSLATLNIGVVGWCPEIENPENLLVAAEVAVLRAKQARGRIVSMRAEEVAAQVHELGDFLQDASSSTVIALAGAVDAKDPYTQGHSLRVAEYARDLALEMKLSPEFADLIYTTGLLHDVGKIGVPDSVLKKPTKLDDEEWKLMQEHPVVGENIVRRVPSLAPTLPGIRHHHERWDGRGYPDHLSGEGIPLMARILGVADSFDAMASDRPYRKGLDIEISLGEIEKNAGIQFDPELAPVFVAMIRRRHAQKAA